MENHPTWVTYQCDGKTPAWTFGQEGPGSVPINIFDPEVLAWQLQYIDSTITEKSQWMDAIAWDNFGLQNGKICVAGGAGTGVPTTRAACFPPNVRSTLRPPNVVQRSVLRH